MESDWRDRAMTAESQHQTLRDQTERLREKVRGIMAAFGARERSDGTLDIDFEALVERLPIDQALELRSVIDQKHQVSGAAGEKPRVSVKAA